MKKTLWSFACALMVVALGSYAFGGVPCDELKGKIDDGLKAKGVQNYTLTVVGMSDTADGKQVGTCDGGTKKIMYTRGEPTVKAAAATTEKPAAKPAAAKKDAASKDAAK